MRFEPIPKRLWVLFPNVLTVCVVTLLWTGATGYPGSLLTGMGTLKPTSL